MIKDDFDAKASVLVTSLVEKKAKTVVTLPMSVPAELAVASYEGTMLR